MAKKTLSTVRGALGGRPKLWIIEWEHQAGRVTGRVVCALADASAHGIAPENIPRLASPLPPPGEGAEWTIREPSPERRKAGP